MNLSTGFKEGIREIFYHKFRSFLTMFGVILGVASLLSMYGLTAGMIAGSREVLQGIGGLEKVGINDSPVPPYQEGMQELSPGRTYRDVIALRQNAPLLSYVSPEVHLGGAKVIYQNKQSNPRVSGVEPDLFFVDKHEMAFGRFINSLDVQNSLRAAVIGDSIAEQLFNSSSEEILGKTIQINGEVFTVVGILTPYVAQSSAMSSRGGMRPNRRWDPFWHKNNLVAIPITTMQTIFKSSNVQGGVDQGPDLKLNELNVQIADLNRFPEALDQMRNIISLTHNNIQDFVDNARRSFSID